MSVTEGPPQTEPAIDLDRPWHLHPQVALRDESFGALAYHYGTRRLHFLKSRVLVDVVTALPKFDSATAAVASMVPSEEQARYRSALAGLAASGVLHVA